MVLAVADTHTIIWYLYNDSHLSATARAFIETAAKQGNQIGISSISFVEIVYLMEKAKIPKESLTSLITEVGSSEGIFAEFPVTLNIANAVSRVSALQIRDMPDRIIAATALHLDLPLISRDAKIQASSIPTIW
jgi:PIN domain nuclease of toxin-antitoxin system